MKHEARLRQKPQYVTSIVAISVIASAGLPVFASEPALAEFQIQEASIEKGETEFEYRGAYHWSVPEATVNNPNANDLVQSHEFEAQYSLTDWWLVQLTVGLEQPLHEDFEASDVEFETEFALIKRKGDGTAVSFQMGYEKSTNGQADVLGFGPIVELASGKLLITLNPLFTDQVGPDRETEVWASTMAGAPNMTSQSIGACVWRCSVRSRISRVLARSTNRTTASARPCSGIPENRKRRVARRRARKIRTTRKLPVLLKWSSLSTSAFSSVLPMQPLTLR